MTAVLNHPPEARSEATPARLGCCNPRPWEPLCVDCPRRFRPAGVMSPAVAA